MHVNEERCERATKFEVWKHVKCGSLATLRTQMPDGDQLVMCTDCAAQAATESGAIILGPYPEFKLPPPGRLVGADRQDPNFPEDEPEDALDAGIQDHPFSGMGISAGEY